MMKPIAFFAILIVFSTLIACKNKAPEAQDTALQTTIIPEKQVTSIQSPTKADRIINESIEAHGGDLYRQADYSFVFRKNTYRFTNNEDQFTYSVTQAKSNAKNLLVNGNLERYENGKKVALSQRNINRYSEALNSVIYFATLPYKLNDAAVNKEYVGNTTIKGQSYEVIRVTFDQEGGGKDYDDEFHYWINAQTKKIDYLAYSYITGDKGVRFRSAYNSRVVDGITFQDYINYKAAWGTPLKDLPAMYEKGKLKELSRIVTEDVVNLKAQ